MIVQSQRIYRDLVTFASDALVVLSNTGLIGRHPAADLYASLQAENCAVCGDYGPVSIPAAVRPLLLELLLLPPVVSNGCSRGSTHVLWPLRATSSTAARLLVCQFCGILVTAKSARDLALVGDGSADSLSEVMVRGCSSEALLRKARYILRDTIPPVWPKPAFVVSVDHSSSLAAMMFPSLSKPGTIGYAHWCRGCNLTRPRCIDRPLHQKELERLVPLDYEAITWLIRRTWLARSRVLFGSHYALLRRNKNAH